VLGPVCDWVLSGTRLRAVLDRSDVRGVAAGHLVAFPVKPGLHGFRGAGIHGRAGGREVIGVHQSRSETTMAPAPACTPMGALGEKMLFTKSSGPGGGTIIAASAAIIGTRELHE
jgi:hypothetical protein